MLGAIIVATTSVSDQKSPVAEATTPTRYCENWVPPDIPAGNSAT